jgi:hypothetical protein
MLPNADIFKSMTKEYWDNLPIRQIRAAGENFRGKYDEKTGMIYMIDENDNPTGEVAQSVKPVNASASEQKKPAEKEGGEKVSNLRFHTLPFILGMGTILILMIFYFMIQYLLYEGIL